MMYWQDDRGKDLFLRSGCLKKMLDVIITFFKLMLTSKYVM